MQTGRIEIEVTALKIYIQFDFNPNNGRKLQDGG